MMHAVLGGIVARSLPIWGLQEAHTSEKADPLYANKTYNLFDEQCYQVRGVSKGGKKDNCPYRIEFLKFN